MRAFILFCCVFLTVFSLSYRPPVVPEWPNNLSDAELEELEKEWDQHDLQIRLWDV